jgi:rhamnosyltransferase
MNIAGVVILYHPDIKQLSENINTYVLGLKQLYIYDNSEIQTPGIEAALNNLHPCIKYQFFNSNEGIAKRLNQAVDAAMQSQYDYLLTMDQDSSFKPGDFEKYKSLIQKGDYTKVAQFGINCQPQITMSSEQPQDALTLITSGSILNLSLIKKVGDFNEDLFIDFVDAEFSYRVVQQGLINLMFSNIVLNHALGTLVEGRGLGNFKKSMRIIHAPTRVFYIVRNGLYLLFKAQGLRSSMKKDVIRCIKIIKNDLIYNPELLAVYKNLFSGISAFLMNRMGKK